ncbi:MAG TPA: hypothetical protein VGO36_02675 [Solirubrobacterales bacterium]|nr:hypothetical protein [Solirubrobacterales bacterium]
MAAFVLAVFALALAPAAAGAVAPTASIGSISEISTNSAVAHGVVNPSDEETGYHFEYAQSAVGPWLSGNDAFSGQAVAANAGPSAVSERLYGSFAYNGETNATIFIALKPGSTYFVRLAAANNSGSVVTGSPYAVFATMPGDPPSNAIPCFGDACQPLPLEPEDPTPGSLRSKPSGNFPAPATKPRKGCGKGKVRRHGKCVKARHGKGRRG